MAQIAGRELSEPIWRFIVDEHDVLDPKTGSYMFTVTADALAKTVEKGNERIKSTGDYTPIIIGHTKDNLPEKDQPEIVGFAGPFKLAPLFDTGRMAIAAQERFFVDKAREVAKKYPRRSVEVTWEDHLIDPVAVLGASTPARDLGLAYSSTKTKFRYEIEEVKPTTTKERTGMSSSDELVAEVVAKLQQTAAWKYLESMAEREPEQDEYGVEDAEQAQEEEEPVIPGTDVDEEESPDDLPSGEDTNESNEDEEHLASESRKMRMAAGLGEDDDMPDTANPSFPSATDVSPAMPMDTDDREKHKMSAKHYHEMAGNAMDAGEMEHYNHCMKMAKSHLAKYSAMDHEGDAPRVENEVGSLTQGGGESATDVREEKLSREASRMPEKLRMELEQTRTRLARYEASDRERAEENKQLKLKYQRIERERDLIQLENEGVDFDRAQELEDVAEMSDSDFDKHKKRMRTRYQKAPFGAQIRTSSDAHLTPPVKGREHPISGNAALSQKAIDMATREGITFAKAYDRVSNNGTGTL